MTVVPRAEREPDSPVTPDWLEPGGNTPPLQIEETDYAPPSLPTEDEEEEHIEELHDYIEDLHLPLTGEKRRFYNQNAILDTRATHN
jgi:hypothetical protein